MSINDIRFSKSVLKKLAIACARREMEKVYEILIRGTGLRKKAAMEQRDIEEAVYHTTSVMSAVETADEPIAALSA